MAARLVYVRENAEGRLYWREDDALLSAKFFFFVSFPCPFSTERGVNTCTARGKRNVEHHTLYWYTRDPRSTIHNEITDSFYEDETRHRDSQSSYSYKQPYASRSRNILNEHMIAKGSSVAVRRAGGSIGAALRSRSAVREIFEKFVNNFRFSNKNYRKIDANVGERV